MVERRYPTSPLMGVATAIFRNGKVLLVKRAKAPNAGLWALPGGLVDVGETLNQAAVREVQEETGLEISAPKFLNFEDVISHDDQGRVEHHFVLAFYAAQSPSGTAFASSDAAALDWFSLDQISKLPTTGSTEKIIKAAQGALAI